MGWSRRGRRIYVKCKPAKRHKLSGIAAIDSTGLLACLLVPGAVNKSIFVGFINDLLESRDLRGRTIICDNVAFHKSREIVQGCETAGVFIQFTPPYSPEFNPVENFLSVVKDELRHHLLASGVPDTFSDFEENVYDVVHAAATRVSMSSFFEGFLHRAGQVGGATIGPPA